MRHFTNISLLLCFITLAISGVLSFCLPFDLDTTRLHIVFGFICIILIGFHLVGKATYFKAVLLKGSKSSLPKSRLIFIVALWLGLVFTSLYNWTPAKQIMANSYESRESHQVVRPNALIKSISDSNFHSTVRLHENQKSKALEIHLAYKPELQIKPAIAIWAESKGGSLIETLYLTPALAYSEQVNWHGKQVKRSQILPIWRHRYTLLTGIDPDGELDIMSGATSQHSFSLEKYLKSDADEYVIYVEVNLPKDTDKGWTDSHLGQPSVLYSTYVDHSEKKKYRLLELTGHSGRSDDEPEGMINYDLDQLSSAKYLIDLGLIETSR